MNAPARLPQPAREDTAERALRHSISIHCPNCGELEMAARVEIATMRDAAAVGMYADVMDSVAVILGEVSRLATQVVHAPLPASDLLRIRFALWMTIEGARSIERAQRRVTA